MLKNIFIFCVIYWFLFELKGKTVLPQIFSVLPQILSVIPQIFFQIFFSLTQFQLPNGLGFSLYQQVQIIFLWFYDREWNSFSIDELNIYIFFLWDRFGPAWICDFLGIFGIKVKKKKFNPPTFENLSKKNFCGKTEKICVLTIKNLWYNSRPLVTQDGSLIEQVFIWFLLF